MHGLSTLVVLNRRAALDEHRRYHKAILAGKEEENMNVGVTGYKTKKSLKEAVKERAVPCFGTSAFGSLQDGEHVAVGPDVYRKRSWYARVMVKDGAIVKVLS